MRHSLTKLYSRAIAACIVLSVPLFVDAQELGATFSAQTKNGVIMTFQLVDTVEMNIQVGTWDGAPAIDTQTLGQVNIPNSAGGMKVVAIAPGAFMGCAGVTAVSIPANVASIGDRAFAGMLKLDTLVVSTTNAVFDSRNDCNAVVETATNTLIVGCRGSSIDPTVTAIGPLAFEGSGISNVMLSADITSIGDSAFAGCDSLSLITSLSLTPFAVNENCFSNQESVELYVPLGSKAAYMSTEGWNSIEHIYEIGAPTEFTDNQGVRYLPQYLGGSYVYTVVRLNEIHTDEIVIPSTVNDYPVTAIDDTAFADRTGLSSITIPASVENIGDQAFVGCDMMTLTILRSDPPMTATTAFDNTENKTLLVPLGSRTTYASVEPWSQFSNIEALGAPKLAKIDGVIYTPVVEGDTYTYTISGNEGDISGTLTLRSDVGGYPVTAIAAEAFKDCTGLTGILTLPSSLISIGDLAFMGCTGLTSSVNIPASITEIGLNPFAGCTGISAFSVNTANKIFDARDNSNTIVHTATSTLVAGGKGSQFPDDILAIAPYAFYDQTSLLAITIPEGVASIGEKAFYGCNQLTSVSVLAPQPPTITEDAFSCYDIATLSVVQGSKDAYSDATGWKNFSYIKEIGIPEDYRDEQGIDYKPYNINDTYAYAVTGFQDTISSRIIIPEYINGYPVGIIESGIFSGLTSLEEVVLPGTTKEVKTAAFANCPNLKVVKWNGEAPINADCFDAPESYDSNLLVFAPEGTESTFEGNVIKGNVAERITLTDGKELRNPQTFTAKRVTYTRNFSKRTAIGQAGGWESIVVPFNVQTIVSAERGVLVPFGGSTNGEETTETRPFWLATYDEVMGFTAATSIKANTPYIIAMPNNEIYPEEYCITGDVTFISENVEMQPTNEAQTVKGSTYSMIPSYAITEAADNHYMLNDFDYHDSDKSYMPGAIFVRGYRASRPFEAYMATEGAGVKAFISIADVANSLEKIMGSQLHPSSSNVYDLGGRKIGNNALKQATRNIYLKDGKKILSK